MILRILFAALVGLCVPAAEAATRIKDISSLQGVRANQLVGYGLVVGLQGSGDTLRNSPFTEQALQSMLDRMGISMKGVPLRARNVAAVAVTAELPAFAGIGLRMDVSIASLGDATSLKGGTLLATPLNGGDGETYAMAQGQVAVAGFTAQGQAETLTQGVPTAGRIPNGALVERTVPGQLADLREYVIELDNPDFSTAARVADVINSRFPVQKGSPVAEERDIRTVVVRRLAKINPARFMAEIGELPVEPDAPARVVVDQRTGTVVIGQSVKISTVAVTQGNLTVRVTEMPAVSQPDPFSNGKTTVAPRTDVSAQETGGHIAVVQGTDLETLVNGLNRMGMKPSDIIAILQAVKTAGALQAELIVQ